MPASNNKTSAQRVRDYRARKKAQGLRLVQFWVPDTSTEEFRREARRQGEILANSSTEKEDQAFIDSVAAIWDDDD